MKCTRKFEKTFCWYYSLAHTLRRKFSSCNLIFPQGASVEKRPACKHSEGSAFGLAFKKLLLAVLFSTLAPWGKIKLHLTCFS